MASFEDFLAQTIRLVDGNHKHGACTLAELLIAKMDEAGWVVCRWDEELQEHTPRQAWDDRESESDKTLEDRIEQQLESIYGQDQW